VLVVRDLVVNYGAVSAVRGVDLDVGEGEVVALLGPNGAGKTSILRAISALEKYRGSIRFEGDEVSRLGTVGCAKRGLIHVPEGRRLFSTLTVHENLQVGMTAAAGRRARYGLADVYDLFPALAALRKRYGWSLSGGEQQMVAIGRALVAAPRLLLLDEPSLGLAPIVMGAVFAAIREIATSTPVLLVEQNTLQALRSCTRACALVDGGVVMSGTPEQLSDRTALLDSYLGQSTLVVGG
jgi:branched-chain amino acid transport system ATP-binding protein